MLIKCNFKKEKKKASDVLNSTRTLEPHHVNFHNFMYFTKLKTVLELLTL